MLNKLQRHPSPRARRLSVCRARLMVLPLALAFRGTLGRVEGTTTHELNLGTAGPAGGGELATPGPFDGPKADGRGASSSTRLADQRKHSTTECTVAFGPNDAPPAAIAYLAANPPIDNVTPRVNVTGSDSQSQGAAIPAAPLGREAPSNSIETGGSSLVISIKTRWWHFDVHVTDSTWGAHLLLFFVNVLLAALWLLRWPCTRATTPSLAVLTPPLTPDTPSSTAANCASDCMQADIVSEQSPCTAQTPIALPNPSGEPQLPRMESACIPEAPQSPSSKCLSPPARLIPHAPEFKAASPLDNISGTSTASESVSPGNTAVGSAEPDSTIPWMDRSFCGAGCSNISPSEIIADEACVDAAASGSATGTAPAQCSAKRSYRPIKWEVMSVRPPKVKVVHLYASAAEEQVAMAKAAAEMAMAKAAVAEQQTTPSKYEVRPSCTPWMPPSEKEVPAPGQASKEVVQASSSRTSRRRRCPRGCKRRHSQRMPPLTGAAIGAAFAAPFTRPLFPSRRYIPQAIGARRTCRRGAAEAIVASCAVAHIAVLRRGRSAERRSRARGCGFDPPRALAGRCDLHLARRLDADVL